MTKLTIFEKIRFFQTEQQRKRFSAFAEAETDKCLFLNIKAKCPPLKVGK